MIPSFTFGRIEIQRRLERGDIAKGEAAGVEPFLSLFSIINESTAHLDISRDGQINAFGIQYSRALVYRDKIIALQELLP